MGPAILRRAVLGAALLTMLVSIIGGAAAGTPRSTSIVPDADNPVLGVVPPVNTPGNPSSLGATAPLALTYHGGLVMHSTTIYSIFWVPSGYTVDATYKSLIDQYLTDTVAANGTTGNLYSTMPQYTDNTANAAYDLHIGGSVIDTTDFPANDCHPTTPANYIPAKVAACVTDAQIISEIRSVMICAVVDCEREQALRPLHAAERGIVRHELELAMRVHRLLRLPL
ncbi:unannotated protein [freshwater metagenome]|uniref:Unannotated protein n=1 Tax=freshwater metagenome TaxID=449393 RepID=A0A6J6NH80_9ZZZZ